MFISFFVCLANIKKMHKRFFYGNGLLEINNEFVNGLNLQTKKKQRNKKLAINAIGFQ